jgi:hypothetical protein
MKFPAVRSLALTAAQFGTGALAAIAFMSSHAIDLYAAWDQLWQGVKLIAGAWAIAGPVLIGATVAYYSTTKSKMADVVADPAGAAAAAQTIAPTPGVVAIADALKKAP